jgi:hypothetical protein
MFRFLTGAAPDPPRGPGGGSAAVAVPEPEADEHN